MFSPSLSADEMETVKKFGLRWLPRTACGTGPARTLPLRYTVARVGDFTLTFLGRKHPSGARAAPSRAVRLQTNLGKDYKRERREGCEKQPKRNGFWDLLVRDRLGTHYKQNGVITVLRSCYTTREIIPKHHLGAQFPSGLLHPSLGSTASF